MITNKNKWKKKWLEVNRSKDEDTTAYTYSTIEHLFNNYEHHLEKLSKIKVKQLLDDPSFSYLMLPFITNEPYFQWTRAELEAKKDFIYECTCCEDKAMVEYMTLTELFSLASADKEIHPSCINETMLSTGVFIHTK